MEILLIGIQLKRGPCKKENVLREDYLFLDFYGSIFKGPSDCLDSSSAKQQRNNKSNKKDDKQNFCYPGSSTRNSPEAEDGRDDRDNEKSNG